MTQKACWYWFTVLVLLFYFSMPRAHAKGVGPIVTPSTGGFQIKYSKDGTPMAVANTVGGVAATATIPVAVSPSSIASVVVSSVITGAEIAGPWGAAIAGVGAVAVFAIPAFIDAHGRAKLRVNPITGELEKADPAVCTVAPCYQYRIDGSASGVPSTDWLLSAAAASASFVASYNAVTTCGPTRGDNNLEYVSNTETSVTVKVITLAQGTCAVTVGNTTSYTIARRSVAPSSAAWIPATVSEAQAAMSAQVPTVAQVQALDDLGFPPVPAPVSLTGPAELAGRNLVKRLVDGSEETEACKFYLEYFPSNIKAHPECTTTTVTPQKTDTKQVTTLHPDGTSTTETVTTVTPAKTTTETTTKDKLDDSSVPAVDTPLGTVPKLYTRQYPDGLTGVWATKKAALLASPLVNLTGALMPSVSPGGTCPVMMISFDLGPWNFGTHDVAPPCYIWALCKWFVLISTGLLCRRLIFGG